jgi:sigma-E factor negative regulatory protein RseC
VIEEQAFVTAVQDGVINVTSYQKPSCGGCLQKSSCGTSSLGRFMGNKAVELVLESELDLKVGDQVVIGIEESAMLWGALGIYILPLIFFFLFGLVGEQLAAILVIDAAELVSLFFALIGFATSYFLVKKNHLWKFSEQQASPTVVRKL